MGLINLEKRFIGVILAYEREDGPRHKEQGCNVQVDDGHHGGPVGGYLYQPATQAATRVPETR